MVGGESGEVDLAVMGNCHASIIGGQFTSRLGLGISKGIPDICQFYSHLRIFLSEN